MVQSVLWLPCKRLQIWIPRTHKKSGMMVCTCDPSDGKMEGRDRDPRKLAGRLAKPMCKVPDQWERLSQTERKTPEEQYPGCPLTPTHSQIPRGVKIIVHRRDRKGPVNKHKEDADTIQPTAIPVLVHTLSRFLCTCTEVLSRHMNTDYNINI